MLGTERDFLHKLHKLGIFTQKGGKYTYIRITAQKRQVMDVMEFTHSGAKKVCPLYGLLGALNWK